MNTSDLVRDDNAFGPPDDPHWQPETICWPRVDRDTARTAWHALDTWIRWCTLRYELDSRVIPPCWYRHGALVEELTALHTAWLTAHTAAAPGNAPLDWHAMFANARHRLQDWVARAGCRASEHRDQVQPSWITEPNPGFLTHVQDDGDHRG
jgi:hypothetical protein